MNDYEIAREYGLSSIDDNEETGETGWKIVNDGAADWAVQRIKEDQEEYFRLNKLAHDKISEINMQIEAAERRMENKTGFLRRKLQEYFATVPHRQTDTTEKYKLLSGELVMKKAKRTIEKTDDTQLIAWLESNDYGTFVKTEKKPAWGEFKKQLEIIDGEIIDRETGMTVDCLSIKDVPESFEVK